MAPVIATAVSGGILPVTASAPTSTSVAATEASSVTRIWLCEHPAKSNMVVATAMILKSLVFILTLSSRLYLRTISPPRLSGPARTHPRPVHRVAAVPEPLTPACCVVRRALWPRQEMMPQTNAGLSPRPPCRGPHPSPAPIHPASRRRLAPSTHPTPGCQALLPPP